MKSAIAQCVAILIIVLYYLTLGVFAQMVAHTVKKRTHSDFKARAAYVLSIFILIALTVSIL